MNFNAVNKLESWFFHIIISERIVITMNTAVIVAAGRGTRMGAGINKQFIPLLDKPVLAHTLAAFQKSSGIDSIILVAGKDELQFCKKQVLNAYGFAKVDKLVEGGSIRQESVYNGLLEVDKRSEIVLIHDGARPIVKQELINRCIEGAKAYGAVSAGVPIKETVKMVTRDHCVEYTPNRENVWVTQTPQAFKLEIIMSAHENARRKGIIGTDDASLVECGGSVVRMIEGYYENIKITTPEDLITAETVLRTIEL